MQTDALGGCNTVTIDSVYCNGLTAMANSVNATCSLCNDGVAWLNVSGGTLPYSYTWYSNPIQNTDTAINLLAGQYSYCVTDAGGCLICDSVTVGTGNCSAHFSLFPNATPHTYDAVNMASGVPPLSFTWSWGDGTFSYTAYPNHTYASAGLFNICLSITDSVGCINSYCNPYYLLRVEEENTMVYVNVIASGTNGSLSIETPVLVFPNPANSEITVSNISKDGSQIRILNLLGEQVKNFNTDGEQKLNINISDLPSGIYELLISDSEKVICKKIIKE